jgi:ribonuclease HII
MNKDLWTKEVADSKLLSPEKRFILASHIRKTSLGFGIGSVSHSKIDKLNIHYASLLAMQRAVENLLSKVSYATKKKIFIYVDGKFNIPDVGHTQLAVVGADSKIFCVSAASIIAKVYRDNLMMKLHHKFPVYNFAQHKGYGILQHRTAIQKHGLSKIHRHSFCSKIV